METTLRDLSDYFGSIPLAISGSNSGIITTSDLPPTFLVFCVTEPDTWYRTIPEIFRKDCAKWKRINDEGTDYMKLDFSLKISELEGFETIDLCLLLKF